MRRVLVLGVLALGCGAPRRQSTEPADGANGITLDCRSDARGKYGVDAPSYNNPRFGALTTTLIIDGRRHHYGAENFRGHSR